MAEKESQVPEQKPDNTLPLRAALSHVFENIGDSVSEKQFAECQSFLRSKLSESKFNSTIHKLHEKIGKDLLDRMNEELDRMMTEESLTDGLGKLKQLLMETPYSPGEIAWRPPGDVAEHLRTFDVSKIDEETDSLTKLVDDLEDENNHLVKTLSKKRQTALTLDKKIRKSTTIGVNSIAKQQKTRDKIQKYVDQLEELLTDHH
ncbi:uncharacterized protein LOC107036859 [Diachasma alloeum]|uniref:uncharacterized protein LOC107036859 n=1 Tax=Diachasma alloeum TaxID=454923 RepID=UPI000738503E|nr:uncharacterized protein LOC107036859 [Diachasma alloeum]